MLTHGWHCTKVRFYNHQKNGQVARHCTKQTLEKKLQSKTFEAVQKNEINASLSIIFAKRFDHVSRLKLNRSWLKLWIVFEMVTVFILVIYYSLKQKDKNTFLQPKKNKRSLLVVKTSLPENPAGVHLKHTSWLLKKDTQSFFTNMP